MRSFVIFLFCLKFFVADSNYEFIFKNGRIREGSLGLVKSKDQEMIQRDAQVNPNVQIRWFEQRLDHFNVANSGTFSQKYWVNNQFYKAGGPAFLFIGGEGPTSMHWMDPNDPGGVADWLKNAELFGAMCFQLEHRFYGDTHVFNRQALADMANFIEGMKSTYGLQNAKWITFGGSYSGALSAWFRLKYPHEAVGVIASSAPVHAKVDFFEYMEVVQTALNAYDPNCLQQVKAGMDAVSVAVGSQAGIANLKSKFKLCDDLNSSNDLDMKNFFATLAANFQGIVQYSQDNRGVYADILTIPKTCALMTAGNPDPIDGLAAVNNLLLDTYGLTCLDFAYWKMIDHIKEISWDENDSSRQWFWQTCTEFGYYQTSDSPNQPFGNRFDLSFLLRQCSDVFGPQFTPDFIQAAINETNLYYGSLSLAQNEIVLPNGSNDPWHALGILTSNDPFKTAIFIHGTSHCADMYPPRSQDVPELIAARKLITQQIQYYLST